MRLNSLDDFYLEELKDLYNAEAQLVRLEEIFQKLGERPEDEDEDEEEGEEEGKEEDDE